MFFGECFGECALVVVEVLGMVADASYVDDYVAGFESWRVSGTDYGGVFVGWSEAEEVDCEGFVCLSVG